MVHHIWQLQTIVIFHTTKEQAVTQVNLRVTVVNELEEPALWTAWEGRWLCAEKNGSGAH